MDKTTHELPSRPPVEKTTWLHRTLGLLAASLGRKSSTHETERLEILDFETTMRELAHSGYNKVRYGRGPWVGDKDGRIIDEWSVSHPKGTIVALTVYKNRSTSGHTVRSSLQRSDFENTGDYVEHVAKWQLRLSDTTSLDETIAELSPTPEPGA